MRGNSRWWRRVRDRCVRCFREENTHLWTHLSRTISLLVMLNISLFFLTGAVTREGYYYPVISLGLLGLASLFSLLPLGLHRFLMFYLAVLGLCLAAGWLMGASIHYWLKTA